MSAPNPAGRLSVIPVTHEVKMNNSALTPARELDSRVNDGIHVQLLWCEDEGRLWVSVTDNKQGDRFCVDVRDRSRALDVFHHPFGYAAHYGVDTRPAAPDGAGATSLVL